MRFWLGYFSLAGLLGCWAKFRHEKEYAF